MPASDAAPLPRAGEVFFDVRGESRTMRVSWYGDTGVAVFSIWNGGTCTGTFRLPIPELPRMIDALSSGPDDASPLPPAGHAAQQAQPGAVDPAPPTAAMQLPGQAGGGQDYPDGPGYPGTPPGPPDARPGYPGDQRVYQDQAGYAAPAAGYEGGYSGAAQGYEDGYADFPQGYEDFPPEYADAGSGYDAPPPRYAGGRHGYGAPDADPGRPYQPAASAGQEPATGGQAGWEPRPDARHAQRAPSGPLPVGQWQGDQRQGDQRQGDQRQGDQRRDDQWQGDQWQGGQHGDEGTGRYAGDGGPAGGYAAEAEPPYPGPAIDELGADPLEADYGGEAEQGFLPGPPTETFSPVAVGGSHSRQAGQPAGPGPAGSRPAGYRPATDDGYPPPEDPQDAGGYPGYARPGDSASESLAYHPGRPGRREREYRPSRDGY